MAEWHGVVDYVSDGAGGPEVHIALTHYELLATGVYEDDTSDAPLPRVGQHFRLVRDESRS